MPNRIGIYAGSFDPVTNGHLDIMRRAAPLFDTFYIVVTNNPKKKYMFNLDERIALLLRTEARNLGTVIPLKDDYLASFALENNATYLVRGVRNGTDLEEEITLSKYNGDIYRELRGWKNTLEFRAHNLETILVPANGRHAHVSSTAVKALIGYPMWTAVIADLVPFEVKQALMEKHALQHP